MSSQSATAAVSPEAAEAPAVGVEGPFTPCEPKTLKETGLNVNDIEGLTLKFLLNATASSGRAIAEQTSLPFGIVHEVLKGLKDQRMLAYRSSAPANDYVYELSELGVDRARHHLSSSTYFGAAPVSLKDYVRSVESQSLRNYCVDLRSLYAAFEGLCVDQLLIAQVGQAVNSGRGLFLYGPPGNGKTTVAERVMSACQETIWIPRTIAVTGELIRVFDPSYHEELPPPESDSLLADSHDRRWVRIRRPTVVVGGELTMEHLEMSRSANTGVNEAPVQLKSNCGALVVDDFGRQRVSSIDLLNRWIVPLEKRFDHLTLQSGRQIRVPFEQLLVFATNLEPRDVADEAFLRRMPFKVEMKDPTRDQFVGLIRRACQRRGIACPDESIEYLLEKHYQSKNRELRFCHPRDLIEQVHSFCEFSRTPMELTEKTVDIAAYNYFAGL